jgi:hypothetical protein
MNEGQRYYNTLKIGEDTSKFWPFLPCFRRNMDLIINN